MMKVKIQNEKAEFFFFVKQKEKLDELRERDSNYINMSEGAEGSTYSARQSNGSRRIFSVFGTQNICYYTIKRFFFQMFLQLYNSM